MHRTAVADGIVNTFDRTPQTRLHEARLAEAAEHHRAGRLEAAEIIYRDLLRQNPDDMTALRRLGLLAIETGHPRDAARLLRRAVELAPDFRAAWIDLARAELDSHELESAVTSARTAVTLDPQRAGAHIALANTLARAGRTHEAIAAYRAAQALRPDHPGVYLGLGNALKTIGRQPEAIEAYRTGIRLQPDYAELYWSLSNLKTFRFADAEVAEMERRLVDPQIRVDAAMHLSFALGKAHEDRGDYPRAFELYSRGNRVRKHQERYDPLHSRRMSARIRAGFTSDFLLGLADVGYREIAPIFIVGLPRSGSTLLEQVLASHPQVEATHELAEGSRLVRQLDRQQPGGRSYPECARELDAAAWRDLGRTYDQWTRPYRTGRPRFIDKMPNNFALVGLLKLALPNARFINATRDPRDTCLSCYKQLFASGQGFTYDLDDLGQYYLDYLRLMHHWHEVLPGAVLDVRYEDVVADLEGQTRRMLEFCGLPWDAACLEFHLTRRSVRTASSEQVRRPLYGDAMGVWRNYERELEPLLEVLRPILA
jgi:tetratricopeptide (TPR) repeat protein